MTISIEQAKLRLAELVEKTEKGEEVVITRDGKEVAQLVPKLPRRARRFGFAKDIMKVISDDDEHLKDFEEYMR